MTNITALAHKSVFCAALAAPLILNSAASAQATNGDSGPILSYFSDWFERVDKTRAEQPHWAPPIATTSPALQEVMRYDISWQSLANGHTLTSYGSGKRVGLLKAIWPAVEVNYTYWPNGSHEYLNQAFIMPEVVLGKFPIYRRLGAMVGAGYQIAVTDHPLYHRNFQLTLRLPF